MIALRTALLLVLAALIFAPRAQAQVPTATLTGSVVDDSTGTPLAGVHVFIAESMLGTTTDGDGRYRLDGVPPGVQRLYVSIIGFEPEARDVVLREAREFVFDFRLNEAVTELEGVTVVAKEDRRWKERLARFTEMFIGETDNSRETKILNPEVLDFTDRGGNFEAFAGEILEIENRALGYRIQYFLKDFAAEPNRVRYDGEPLYEELEPSSPEEAERWEENRRMAFYGSFRHFMLAVISGRAKEHGFETFWRPKPEGVAGDAFNQASGIGGGNRAPLDPNTLLSEGEAPNEQVLTIDGAVEIIFKGELEADAYAEWQKGYGQMPGGRGERYQTSVIFQERGPTIVDYKGDILNPYGVTFTGYLAFERVADELPKEYRPSR